MKRFNSELRSPSLSFIYISFFFILFWGWVFLPFFPLPPLLSSTSSTVSVPLPPCSQQNGFLMICWLASLADTSVITDTFSSHTRTFLPPWGMAVSSHQKLDFHLNVNCSRRGRSKYLIGKWQTVPGGQGGTDEWLETWNDGLASGSIMPGATHVVMWE